MEALSHTATGPEMVPAFASAFTVISRDTVAFPQEVVTEYVIVVVPADTPVTRPVAALTVAAAVLLLLHVPPAVPVTDKVVEEPAHTPEAPDMLPTPATALTVISLVAANDPQPFETV